MRRQLNVMEWIMIEKKGFCDLTVDIHYIPYCCYSVLCQRWLCN